MPFVFELRICCWLFNHTTPSVCRRN